MAHPATLGGKSTSLIVIAKALTQKTDYREGICHFFNAKTLSSLDLYFSSQAFVFLLMNSTGWNYSSS